jgi:hypothetical protein
MGPLILSGKENSSTMIAMSTNALRSLRCQVSVYGCYFFSSCIGSITIKHDCVDKSLAKYNRVPCFNKVGYLVQNLNNGSKVRCASIKTLKDEQEVCADEVTLMMTPNEENSSASGITLSH